MKMNIDLQEVKLRRQKVYGERETAHIYVSGDFVYEDEKYFAIQSFIESMGYDYSVRGNRNGETFFDVDFNDIEDRNEHMTRFKKEWAKVVRANEHFKGHETLIRKQSVWEKSSFEEPMEMSCELAPTGRIELKTERGSLAQYQTGRALEDVVKDMSEEAAEYMYSLLAAKLGKA